MTENKDCIECRECDPDEHPNECYLSACADIVTGKVDFKCIGKKDPKKKSGKI